MISKLCLHAAFLLAAAYRVSATSQGALDAACCTMTPGHYGMTPQTTTPPYKVMVSSTVYNVSSITVTLESPEDSPFKGFLLQARRADPALDTDTLIGTFQYNDSDTRIRYTSCGKNRDDSEIGLLSHCSLTHTTNVAKTRLSFRWFPPPKSEGHVVFRCTFVHAYQTFWVAVNSDIIRDNKLPSPHFTNEQIRDHPTCKRNLPPTTTSLTSPTTVTTTTPTTTQETTTTPAKTTTQTTAQETSTTTNIHIKTTAPNATRQITTTQATTLETTTTSTRSIAANSSISPTSSTTASTISTIPPAESTTTGRTITPSTTITERTTKAVPSLNRRPDCYTKWGCFDNCNNVTGRDCRSTFAWQKIDETFVIELRTLLKYDSQWVAIGLSYDRFMGNDSVTECVKNGDEVKAHNSRNLPNFKANKRSRMNDFILPPVTSVVNGVLTCLVKMDWKPIHNREWHLLLAKGQAPSGQKIQHEDKDISDLISLLEYTQTTGTPTGQTAKPVKTDELGRPTECFKTKGCFDDCDDGGKECTIVASWTYRGDNSLLLDLESNNAHAQAWMAIGFSVNDRMALTSVVECLRHKDVIAAQTSYNDKNYVNHVTEKTSGVKLVESSYNQRAFRCTIDIKPHDTTKSQLVDFSKTWFLLLARGRVAADGTKIQHDLKISSGAMLNVSEFQKVTAVKKDNYMVKIHACLMLTAWIFVSSVGIFIARFFKDSWPKTTMCKKNIWFIFHVSCMAITLMLTVTGFVIIFVDVQGYSQIGQNSTWIYAHPILGIIVMALVLLNPTMAIFRCHPEDEKRWIFNWAHWAIGKSAWILANIAIFSAFSIERALVVDEVKYLWYAHVCYQVLAFLALEIYRCIIFADKRERSYDVNPENDQKDDSFTMVKPSYSSHKSGWWNVVLLVHVLIVAGLFITLIIFILKNKAETVTS